MFRWDEVLGTVVLILQKRGIYEISRWTCVMWLGFHIKIRAYRFRHSRNIKVIGSTVWEAAVLVLLKGGGYRIRRSDCLRCHRFRHSNNVKVIISTIWETALLVLLRNVSDLWSMPLKWLQVTWYAEYHDDRFRHSRDVAGNTRADTHTVNWK